MNDRILTGLLGVLVIAGITHSLQPSRAENIDCSPPDNCVPGDARSPDTEIEIFSPSANTQLTTQTPTLSWSAVEGATYYILWVQDTQESELKQEVTVTDLEIGQNGLISIDYLFDRPLSPETEYQLAIETQVEEVTMTNAVIFSISSPAEIEATRQSHLRNRVRRLG